MKPGAKYRMDAEGMRPLIRQQLAQVEAARHRREMVELVCLFVAGAAVLVIVVAMMAYAGGPR